MANIASFIVPDLSLRLHNFLSKKSNFPKSSIQIHHGVKVQGTDINLPKRNSTQPTPARKKKANYAARIPQLPHTKRI